MTNVLKQATAMALMVGWLRDNAAEGPPKVGPQMGSVESVATELREEIFRMANALATYEEGVTHPDVTVGDADYVLRWLIQSEAPPNIVGLQRSVVFAARTANGVSRPRPLRIVQ